MKPLRSKYFLVLIAALVSIGIAKAQSLKVKLNPDEFSGKIKSMPNAPVIDVRTPDEFSKGHLAKAKNVNWNSTDFDKQLTGIDKSKPVLVYCLSGARSSAAAQHMRDNGFKNVYELEGGIMRWRAANLPLTTDNDAAKSTGMTNEQFKQLLNTKKIVLIDFYAEWCAPCKKMKPYLEEISKEMADKVIVVRINADENPELCKSLGIDGLPVLQVYKNNKLSWSNKGFIEKKAVVDHLK